MTNIDLDKVFRGIQKHASVLGEALNPEVYALENDSTIKRLLEDKEVKEFLQKRINALKNIERVRNYGQINSVDKLLFGVMLANKKKSSEGG